MDRQNSGDICNIGIDVRDEHNNMMILIMMRMIMIFRNMRVRGRYSLKAKHGGKNI